MAEVLEKILASDLLLFSFPLHSYGMPAARWSRWGIVTRMWDSATIRTFGI